MVALDLETTGLDARRDVIVSIGLVPFSTARIHSPRARYWVVRPDCPLTSKSIIFHRITHSAVANAPALNALFDDLMQALAGQLVVVHFKQIERHFLNLAAQQIFGDSLLFPVIDTMAIERKYYRDSKRVWWKHLLGAPRPSLRLNDCRARYHLPQYEAHHALVDAQATAELLQAQLSYHYSHETPVGDLWE